MRSVWALPLKVRSAGADKRSGEQCSSAACGCSAFPPPAQLASQGRRPTPSVARGLTGKLCHAQWVRLPPMGLPLPPSAGDAQRRAFAFERL